MALTKILRHRAPLDGTVFTTLARPNSILRAYVLYDDDKCVFPDFLNETLVPVHIRMALYQAQKTRQRPDGMIYGPVIRIGSIQSPEVEMFGHHHACGLTYDAHLDGWDTTDRWMYEPYGYGDAAPPGEDVSAYQCDKCHERLYRDDLGRRENYSACLFNGELVCRGCDVTGLVYDAKTEEQLARARRLADFVGPECRQRLDRQIEQLGHPSYFGHPSQTRLFRDSDKYSFDFQIWAFTPDGKKRGLTGGLIQFGPHPTEGEDGTFAFRQWDYDLKAMRPATPEEISGISYSTHT